jgi:hypothetical protein
MSDLGIGAGRRLDREQRAALVTRMILPPRPRIFESGIESAAPADGTAP